ncbi:membrane protein of ER body 1-like isoform X2 [Salvia hispanica]|uniref:membrane protein of ER body 1-like isoform X2 n=1 Tax=Salvia hispanica TaxID=49212 RepID=UPI002009D425|nr:membrane protein of ER body 1-like isoform X2 [Salvia hispanica]
MADMEKVNEKEEEEELPPPPSDVTDQVEDDANDMAPVDQINKAETEMQETEMTMKAAGLKIGGGFRYTQESKVGEQEEEGSETKKGSSEDGERERNETIEFEVTYVDNGEKEVELVLDLDKFKRYAPHCHNCNHLATKLILRRKIPDPNPNPNQIQTKKYWFVVWFEFFFVWIWGKLDLTPGKQVHQPADSGKSANKETRKEGGKDLLPNLPNKNGNDPKRDIENDENDGKHKVEGEKDKHPSTDKPDKNENKELRNEKKNEKQQKTRRSESESSDSEADTDEEEEEEDTKPKILELLTRLRGSLKLVEILKCIVYGGLIESITSLSVVASGAATDASTLNVFAIGLALLFSGLIAIGNMLVELKRGRNKHYKEQLGGSKKKFVFHSTLVILSYLVFGLVAPSTFAFTFVDKYAKILAAAAAAFSCIFILAIAKVYTSEDKHFPHSYIEMACNYLIISFFTSGIAYTVGYSIEMYVLKLGLFTSVERVSCYHGEAY